MCAGFVWLVYHAHGCDHNNQLVREGQTGLRRYRHLNKQPVRPDFILVVAVTFPEPERPELARRSIVPNLPPYPYKRKREEIRARFSMTSTRRPQDLRQNDGNTHSGYDLKRIHCYT
jgi:hypothetical protein